MSHGRDEKRAEPESKALSFEQSLSLLSFMVTDSITLRVRVRSSVTWERLGVEPLLLCLERNQLRWFRYLVRMPPERYPRKVLIGRRPLTRPKTRWRKYISTLAEEHIGILQRVWMMLLRIGNTGDLCWNCYPCDPIPDKQLKLDGWMGLMLWPCWIDVSKWQKHQYLLNQTTCKYKWIYFLK